MLDDSETYTLSPISITLRRYGRICILTLLNYVTPTAITTDTKICDLPVSAQTQTFGVGKVLGGADVFLYVYNDGLYVSSVTGLVAGTPTYATMIFAV